MKKCFGIVSYLPDDLGNRQARINRLNRLFNQLGEFWPDIDILVIAQNWKDYAPVIVNNLIRFNYSPLGILKARQTLRTKFLDLAYDYIIMLDDDCIIECQTPIAHLEYIAAIDAHPQGFCFIRFPAGHALDSPYCPYKSSQLNLCAISRYIYEQTPMVPIDANNDEGYEDRIFSCLLHNKFAEYEFIAPSTITHVHFKNPNINNYGGEVLSTWSRSKRHNWGYLNVRTLLIEKYITEHKELPGDLKLLWNR